MAETLDFNFDISLPFSGEDVRVYLPAKAVQSIPKKKWITFFLIFVLMVTSVLVSCQQTIKTDNPAQNHIINAAITVTDVKTALAESTGKIKTSATDGIAKTQGSTTVSGKSVFQDFTDIMFQVSKQEQMQDQLTLANTNLAQAHTENAAMHSTLDKTLGELQDEKEAATQELHKKLVWLIVAATAASGIFLALFFTGHAWAIGGAIGSGAVVGVSLVVQSLAVFVPWILGGAIIIGLGFIIYQFVSKNNTVKQLVHLTEVAKGSMPEAARVQLFGTSTVINKPIASIVQSNATQSLVRRYRNALLKV